MIHWPGFDRVLAGAAVRTLALVVPALLVSLLAAVDARALGANDGVDVTWAAPGECPSSADLQERVTARIPSASAVRARGRVERSASTWRLALDIETPAARGERTLEASTCDALASAAAVVIAMSIAPPRAEPPPPSPAIIPLVAPSSQRAAASEQPASVNEPAPARLHARGQVTTDAGTLPSASVGGGLALGVRVVRDLSLEASASVFAGQDGTVEGTTRGASFSLCSAGVRACWSLTRRIELAPCLGVVVDRISATGFGAARVSDASSLAWSPEALLALGIPLAGPLALRAGVGAQAPMSRQSFVINGAGTVHRADPVALRAWLGPEVRF